MTFISYAQNFEDVMLWRALKHLKNGFYIDVGAAWPDMHSVTKAFYDAGWRGVNIEPNPVHYAALQRDRPRDVNLQLALSREEGRVIMDLIEDTGLSTLDHEIAREHRSHGWNIQQQEIAVSTLANVYEKYVPLDQNVHFLKIDVEGLEEQVLLGNQWDKYRPWIVVVEATRPATQLDTYINWEMILTGNNYIFAYADGLNRYYVASEHQHISTAFKYPPNVFDGFKLAAQQQSEVQLEQVRQSQQAAEARAQQLEAQLEQVRQSQQAAEARARQSEVRAALVLAELQAVYASRSWRVTAPLRTVGRIARELRWSAIKARFRVILQRVARYTAQRPRLRRLAMAILRRTPVLKSWLMRVVVQQGIAIPIVSQRATAMPSIVSESLSPRAMQIYTNLVAAIAQRRGGL